MFTKESLQILISHLKPTFQIQKTRKHLKNMTSKLPIPMIPISLSRLPGLISLPSQPMTANFQAVIPLSINHRHTHKNMRKNTKQGKEIQKDNEKETQHCGLVALVSRCTNQPTTWTLSHRYAFSHLFPHHVCFPYDIIDNYIPLSSSSSCSPPSNNLSKK